MHTQLSFPLESHGGVEFPNWDHKKITLINEYCVDNYIYVYILIIEVYWFFSFSFSSYYIIISSANQNIDLIKKNKEMKGEKK